MALQASMRQIRACVSRICAGAWGQHALIQGERDLIQQHPIILVGGQPVLSKHLSFLTDRQSLLTCKERGHGAAAISRQLGQTPYHGQQAQMIEERMVDSIPFDNLALRRLPIEYGKTSSTEHRLVKDACFTRLPDPEPLDNPRLVAASAEPLKQLHIDVDSFTEEELAEYFSGSRLFPGSEPAAHTYCGYQYGLFSGQLGDGAVMYIGEAVSSDRMRNEIQLKGCGRTPFSRVSTDGRKVLRSSIRELIAAEALSYMGIPTSRVATCVTSDTDVYRDIMYTGNITPEKATVVCRTAPTFLRIGSLEVALGPDNVTGKSGPSQGNVTLQREILDHLIGNYYPLMYHPEDPQEMYASWFWELLSRSAVLVAQWQTFGFCHGVINTDNISLVGVTIDYGPFAFLDYYDPDFICNASDHWARFSYRRQPEAMRWCFERLVDTMSGLVPRERLEGHLQAFDKYYEMTYLDIMRTKLGLRTSQEYDKDLIDGLLRVMQQTGADYSKTFRALSSLPDPRCDTYMHALQQTKGTLLNLGSSVRQMKHIYRMRQAASKDGIVRSLWVLQSNPELIPLYTKSAMTAMEELNQRPMVQQVKKLTPQTKHKQDKELWEDWLNKYSGRILAESEGTMFVEEDDIERRAAMDCINPRFVPKNHILQKAIEDAEQGNYATTRALLQLIKTPFDEHPEYSVREYREEAEMLLKIYDAPLPEQLLKVT